MKHFALALALFFLGAVLAGCGGYSGNSSSPSCNGGGGGGCAKPTITSLSVTSAAVNSGPITLTITGTQFALGDNLEVDFGDASTKLAINKAQSTSTSLVVTIPNSALQYEQTYGISMQDITSGNAAYPPLPFTVTTACPVQGNEAALFNGSSQWIFEMKGENAGNPMAMVGLFKPDATGGILFGVEDINEVGSAPDTNEPIIQPSFYSEDSQGRGCLELRTAKGLKIFHFSSAGMMEFDDTTGSGERAVGSMTAALPGGTVGSFPGGIFGLEGWDLAGGHAAIAGNFATQSNGGAGLGGSITGGLCDTNDAGTVNANVSIPSGGTYNIVSGVTGQPNGRGTISFMAGSIPVSAVVYLGNVGNFYILSTTQVSASVPLLSGQGGASAPTYLNGTSYYYLFRSSGKDGATVGTLALVSTGTNVGTVTGNIWQDVSGTAGITGLSGTYTITNPTWGRVTFSGTGLNNAPVAYILGGGGYPSPQRGVTVGTDSDAASGVIWYQDTVTPNFTTADFAFPAGYSNVQKTSSGMTTKVGVITMDGKSGYSGTADVSGPNGLSTNQSITGTYSINLDGSGNLGPNEPLVSFFIPPSLSLIFYIDESAGVIHPSVSSIHSQ